MNADTLDHFGIVLAALDSAQKSRRETGAAGQLSDPLQSAHGRNWHDTGDNRDVDVGEGATFTEIEEVAILKK